MSSRSSVDRAPAWCLGGHGFDSYRGLRIFLCPTLVSCWLIHLHISLPSLKFTISIKLSSFTWFLNYFFAKFLEILTTGLSEISKFLQKQSVLSNFSSNCARAAFNWILSVTKKKPRIAGFFALLPFLTYLCNKRLKPSIPHCIQ